MGLISFLFGKKKDDDELAKKQKQVNESTSSAVPTEQEPHDQDDQSIVDNILAEEERESLRTAAQEDNESVFGAQDSEDDVDSIAAQVEAAEKKEQPCDSNKQVKELNPQAPQATKASSAKVVPTVASEGKGKVEIPVPSARHLDLTKDSPFRDGTLPPIPENEVEHEPAPVVKAVKPEPKPVAPATPNIPATSEAPEPTPAPVAEPAAPAAKEAKPEPKTEVKLEPQTEPKVEPKAEAKVESKAEAKLEVKVEDKTQPAQPAPKPEKAEKAEPAPVVRAVEPEIAPAPEAEPQKTQESLVDKAAPTEVAKAQGKEEGEGVAPPPPPDTSAVEAKSEAAAEPSAQDKDEGKEKSEDDSEPQFKSKYAVVREEEAKEEEEHPDIGPAPAPMNVPVAVRTQPVSPIDSWSRVDDSLETATAKSQANQTDGAQHSADEVLDGRSLASKTSQAAAPDKSTKPRKHSENHIEATASAKDKAKVKTAATTKTSTAMVPAVASPETKVEEKKSFFSRLKRTRDTFTKSMASLIRGRKIDDELFDDLETDLLMADVGGDTTYRLIDRLREESNLRDLGDAVALRKSLKSFLVEILKPCEQPLVVTGQKPYVILMVGVNGAGKTTTIGKLARKYQDQGLSVMLAAGDTFRAAAVEQLKEWGERTKVPVIAQGTGSDSASVLYDAVNSAKSRKIDVLICDTAGRLQNKAGLMGELKKIVRVMKKLDPQVPHEVLLVLDGTTGQNAVSQVKNFNEAVKVTGLVLTKLDGTAKGGIVFSLADLFKIPIRYVGIGERVEDLREFKVEPFVDALIDDKDIE